MLDLIGRKLGKYRITGKIGQGGMAIVYKAVDTTLQRTVALKVMLPHLATDVGFVKRFQHEAITAANLKHPHIVTIYEVGEQEGIYYIAMEYLPGRTLRQIIKKEGKLSLERTVKLFNQIADALTHAHHQGLIHRDIKPGNILIDAQDNVTLTDFGIVKAAQYVTILTGPGRLVGTPQYMSPEHAEGKELDHRSDIYALGVVLYEMLTGKVPFNGKTPTPILYAHVYKKPPSPRRINPKIPRPVEKVVLKALAKRPEMRYQSAVEMAQDLREGVERAERVSEAALFPSVVEAVLDFWQFRRPVLFASIAVLMILVTLFLGREWVTGLVGRSATVSPTPTPTLTAMPTPSPTTTQTATHTPVPSLTSTPTSANTPTPTPLTPTPTPVPPTATATPTATPTPTPTPPTPTSTIAPTPGPSATVPISPTPLPTTPLPSPTPTPRPPTLLPAPTLIGPGGGAEFVRGQVVVLQWDWTGKLGPDEWFSVLMRHEEQESHIEIVRVTSKESSLHEPPDSKYGHYFWKVVVVREVEDGTVQVSESSEEQNFWWVWEKPTGPEKPTPTPTKQLPPTEEPTPTPGKPTPPP